MSVDPSLLEDDPPVDDTSATWRRLEPVTFFGERVPCFPADRPAPWHETLPALAETRALRGGQR